MRTRFTAGAAIGCAALLAACNGGSTNGTEGPSGFGGFGGSGGANASGYPMGGVIMVNGRTFRDAAPTPNDTSAVAGFYDLSVPTDGETYYQHYSADGWFTSFEYDGNPGGDGRNCFHVTRQNFASLGDDRYRFSDGSEYLLSRTLVGLRITTPGLDDSGLVPYVVGTDPIDLNVCN